MVQGLEACRPHSVPPELSSDVSLLKLTGQVLTLKDYVITSNELRLDASLFSTQSEHKQSRATVTKNSFPMQVHGQHTRQTLRYKQQTKHAVWSIIIMHHAS